VRQDAPADHGRWRVGVADRLQNALDPVRCGDRVVIDVGDIGAIRIPCSGIARHADPGLLDTQQSRVVKPADQAGELRGDAACRGAVHHEDVELFVANRLPPQSVQAIAHIAGPVMRADAGGDVHAAQCIRGALRKD
jgi:hypothetical protein